MRSNNFQKNYNTNNQNFNKNKKDFKKDMNKDFNKKDKSFDKKKSFNNFGTNNMSKDEEDKKLISHKREQKKENILFETTEFFDRVYEKEKANQRRKNKEKDRHKNNKHKNWN